jgi:hypothetical protein
MFIVCANHDDDFVVDSCWKQHEEAEARITELFRAVSDTGNELVKIGYQGDSLYATRFKPEPFVDEYEYVDNDGNPINADGSEKVEGAPVVEEQPYVYEDSIWIIRFIQSGKPIELSASEHYLFATGLNHPFEADENLIVVAVA